MREALLRDQGDETLGEAPSETLPSSRSTTSACCCRDQGKYDEAEPLYREALKVKRETLGDRHPSTLASINNLGLLLSDQGKYDEAEPLYREALKVQRETLGDRHPDTLVSINNIGLLLVDQQGKYDEVERAVS